MLSSHLDYFNGLLSYLPCLVLTLYRRFLMVAIVISLARVKSCHSSAQNLPVTPHFTWRKSLGSDKACKAPWIDPPLLLSLSPPTLSLVNKCTYFLLARLISCCSSNTPGTSLILLLLLFPVSRKCFLQLSARFASLPPSYLCSNITILLSPSPNLLLSHHPSYLTYHLLTS